MAKYTIYKPEMTVAQKKDLNIICIAFNKFSTLIYKYTNPLVSKVLPGLKSWFYGEIFKTFLSNGTIS